MGVRATLEIKNLHLEVKQLHKAPHLEAQQRQAKHQILLKINQVLLKSRPLVPVSLTQLKNTQDHEQIH